MERENRLVQHHTIADAFVRVKDEATEKALSAARAEIGEAEWKKGFTVEKRDKVREALKAQGVPVETQIAGKLDRVSLAETRSGNQVFQKLRVTLDNGAGKTVLSADLGSEFAQRLIAKLDAAQPGHEVAIGGFASVKEKDGRTFVDHVATLKDAAGKEIQPVKEHFKEAQALADQATQPLKAAGLGANQTVLTQTASAAREQYFAQVVRELESRFPERAVPAAGKKQEYPRMEAHMKSQEGTWHSVSLYVDQKGQPRGVVAVENKGADIAEKASVVFAEKVSLKTNEKFLSARMDREDGRTLYVHLTPHEKDGERWLAASFAERDPSKEVGKQFVMVEGKGGSLKPNQALLDMADKDRTAQYLRETLKVDPVKVHEREQARQSTRGLER